VATNRTAGNPVTLDVASPVTVVAGDWLHFQVNKATNDLCDVVYWNPSVAYMTIRRIGDADNDGLADWVEDRNGNGVREADETDWLDPDTDHDGRSDPQEAIDGTDPLDPDSVKRVRLAWWRFDSTNWLGQAGQVPLVARNVAQAQYGNCGFGVVVAGTNANQPDLLSYRAIETRGTPTLAPHAGSIRFIYRPHWFSRLPSSDTNYYPYSGDGPGQTVRLIEIGDAAEQQTPGYLSVDIDPDGTNLFIRSRSGTGTVTTNLTLPIRVLWLPDMPVVWEFFEVLVGWSLTNTYAQFLGPTVGSFSANGLTNAYPPNSAFLAGGLRVGTGASAASPARGEICEVETFNWQGLITTNACFLAATSSVSPPSLTLSWTVPPGSISYAKRRTTESTNWGPTFAVCGDRYVDTEVDLGQVYEYNFNTYHNASSSGDPIPGNRYSVGKSILAALYLPPVEYRGRVLLAIDENLADSLTNEIRLLTLDLVGDGWTVVSNRVSRHQDYRIWEDPASNAVYRAQVAAIKNWITNYTAYTNDVRAVLLLGHVSVPYSGLGGCEDGHVEHMGPWPADAYYGDVDGLWTDTNTWSLTNPYTVLQNDAGDGKFDQWVLPGNPGGTSAMELAVGRIDLSRLPAFASNGPVRTETNLLQQYLAKNHRYRHAGSALPALCLWTNGFEAHEMDWFVQRAIGSSAAWFGASSGSSSLADPFHGNTQAVFAFAEGWGGHDNINNIRSNQHSTKDLAQLVDPIPVDFYCLYGSWFCDWNWSDDMFSKAVLGMTNYGIASLWLHDHPFGGTSRWQLSRLGVGFDLGQIQVQSVNQAVERSSVRTFFILGDPTLRMPVLPPPSDISLSTNGSGAFVLTWSPSSAQEAQYFVYRSTNPAVTNSADFVRLTPMSISATNFVDPSPPVGSLIYEVRAIRVEHTGCGAFTNLSQGLFAPSQ
jgi:hypothetical protein